MRRCRPHRPKRDPLTHRPGTMDCVQDSVHDRAARDDARALVPEWQQLLARYTAAPAADSGKVDGCWIPGASRTASTTPCGTCAMCCRASTTSRPTQLIPMPCGSRPGITTPSMPDELVPAVQLAPNCFVAIDLQESAAGAAIVQASSCYHSNTKAGIAGSPIKYAGHAIKCLVPRRA